MNNEMMIRTMDPMLIRIYQIKDIEEISYQDLVPSSNEGKINVLPSLYVTYDGGKYLSLCSQDKYFDVFVRKVFQVYNLEKDRVIVDPDFDPFGSRTKLRIDDRTKAILESGNLTRINEIYCFYDQKKSYENSLVFQNDKLKLLLPVIKYHLKQLFDCTDRVITMEETLINGYRNNYGIMYKLDGVIDTLLINFINNSDNEYFLNIRSKDKRFKPIEMRIKFNKTSIDVDTYFKDYDLFSSNEYRVNRDSTIDSIFRVTKKGLPIIYKNNALDKLDNPLPNITGIDSSDDVTWYLLPWNAMYGVKNEIQVLSDVDEIVMTHNKYLALVDDEFMLKEYASKEYQRRKTFDANANRVVMDEVDKRIYGLLLDEKENIYLLETYFSDVVRSNGYYDSYLSDKYYYHIGQNKDRLLSLNRNDLVTINQDNNIVRSADLLVTDDMKRLLKR